MLKALLGWMWPLDKTPRYTAVYPDIPQEKAVEYMQVAGLLCLDLDLLQSIAKQRDMTLEELREHIDLTVEKKDELVSSADVRQNRYSATAMLIGLRRG